MKSHADNPGTGATAAQRQELDPELSSGASAGPGSVEKFGEAAAGELTGSDVFGDLRRRNERRARFARLPQRARPDRLKVERIAQLGREHRSRRAG